MNKIYSMISLGLAILFIVAVGGYYIFSGQLFNKCARISNAADRDLCYSNAAGGDGNASNCDKIGTSSAKDICLSNVAMKDQNSNLCEQAGTQRDSCYKKQAILTNDATLCAKLTDKQYDQSFCYSKVAQNKKDASICALATVFSIKENCLNNLK